MITFIIACVDFRYALRNKIYVKQPSKLRE